MKNNMPMKLIFAAIAIALLSACGEPTKTAEYYSTHQVELTADLTACKSSSMNTFNCNEAAKAAAMLNKK
ncbi:MAG: EexN family lipoprotein [Nitrosomonadales bacterium]|nr:EexN family lipoprotein [Nitrosomonadales bacterium]